MRPLLWLVVAVALVLAGATGAVATVHDRASHAVPAPESAATRTLTSGLGPAIFPAKPELRIGAWADRRPGKLHHQLTPGVVLALLLCALVPFLIESGTAYWHWTALRPWTQRAPPLFRHLTLS